MAERPAIVVDDVSKRFRLYKERAGSVKEAFTKRAGARYEDFWAVRNVSLEVPHGAVYGLVGHNGSGKSTLLKMMAAILKPTSGAIRTDGRISALLELGAGFHPDLSGRENIYLNAAILGLHRREVDAIFDDIVDFSGLGSFVDSPVKHYSSGMFVRLGFSVAVHVNPRILIIDEVIAVGDEEFQRRCFEHLYKLRRDGVTIVMVTHSLNLVQAMCDQAAWLDHGNLKAIGTGDEVVHEYLAQVNDAEAERLADDRVRIAQEVQESLLHEPVAAPSERPVVLEGIEVLDPDGQPVSLVTPFSPLTVRFHYQCRRPLERPLFSFSMVNEHGVLAANPGMRSTPGEQPMFVGAGHVDYVIDRLLLGPGEYRLSAAVHDAHATMAFDKKDDIASLVIRSSGIDDFVAGVTDLAGSWHADPPGGPTS
jgi:lipopolysaccharide transport system ATP-binding protein